MSFFKLWKALSLFSFLVLCVHANSSEPLAVQSNLGTDTATSVPDGTDGGLNLAASWTTLPGQSDNDYSNPAEVFLASSENSPVDCSGSSMRSRRRLSKGKRDTNIICPWEQPSSDLSSPAGQQPAPASQLDTTGTSSSGTGRTKNPAKNRGGSRGKEQNNQIVPTKPLMGEPNLELCHELYPIPVCHRPFFGSIHEETPEVWSLIPCRGCEFPSPLSPLQSIHKHSCSLRSPSSSVAAISLSNTYQYRRFSFKIDFVSCSQYIPPIVPLH